MQRLKRLAGKPKPLPFTEEQISVRAYELWEKRGQQGTPEENWQAAIAALKREQSPFWKLRQLPLLPFRVLERLFRFLWRLPVNVSRLVRLASTAETPGSALDVVKVVISALGLLATVLAGIGLVVNYQQGEERLITDRFAKSVEQLGSQDVDVRLGGIYSLERIAKDSPKDYWTVMEVLTAYVRTKSPLPEGWIKVAPEKRKPLPNVAIDVQSTLTVIARREAKNDQGKRLDLSSSNLSGAVLSGADIRFERLDGTAPHSVPPDSVPTDSRLFNGANPKGANFIGVNFRGSNLKGAVLFYADLRSADLYKAVLVDAELGLANLRLAYLMEAEVSGADLSDTDCRRAFLKRANLKGTDIFDADLRSAYGIAPDQIKQAKDWQKAHYRNDFRQQLGLPPEQIKD